MEHDDILRRVLDQNDRLISALTQQSQGNSPVEIIRALTPVPLPAETTTWTPPEDALVVEPRPDDLPDPWGDPEVTSEDLRIGGMFGGYDPSDDPEPEIVGPERD